MIGPDRVAKSQPAMLIFENAAKITVRPPNLQYKELKFEVTEKWLISIDFENFS